MKSRREWFGYRTMPSYVCIYSVQLNIRYKYRQQNRAQHYYVCVCVCLCTHTHGGYRRDECTVVVASKQDIENAIGIDIVYV